MPSFVFSRFMFGVLGYLPGGNRKWGKIVHSLQKKPGNRSVKGGKEYLFISLSEPGTHPPGLPQPVEPQTGSSPGRTRGEAVLRPMWPLLMVNFQVSFPTLGPFY